MKFLIVLSLIITIVICLPNPFIKNTNLKGKIYPGFIYNKDIMKKLVESDIEEVEKMLKDIELGDDEEEFDWRKKYKITPVGNQGLCGSCWAFGITGMLESRYTQKYNKTLTLSKSQVVECDKYDEGCFGGDFNTSEEYILENGLESDTMYPYRDMIGDFWFHCEYNKSDVVVEVEKFIHINGSDNIQKYLYNYGPILVAFDATTLNNTYDIMMSENNTCITDNSNHAVLLVGYGKENDTKYWIVKNSWGKNFGLDGYFRIERGNNTCGIEDVGVSAILK